MSSNSKVISVLKVPNKKPYISFCRAIIVMSNQMGGNQFPEFDGSRLKLNNFPDDESVIGFLERFNLIPTIDYSTTHARCTVLAQISLLSVFT